MFFLVGAPRCGTTAMYEYLRRHPEIYMPVYDKEPHFFGSDFVAPRFARFRGNEKKYRRLFAGAGKGQLRGEASVFYLYSREAANEIRSFDRSAKVLVMLRNPVDMLYSYHQFLVSLGDEVLTSFEDALAAEKVRKAGQQIPQNLYLMAEALYYRDVARFSEQVARYFDVFGREQVHVVIFDDFKTSTEAEYRKVLAFLGVDCGFKPDFTVVNANQEVRSRRLQRLLRNPRLVSLVAPIEPIVLPAYTLLRRLNVKRVPRSPLPPELRQRLQEEFVPEVRKLSDLLRRDLMHWCRDQPGG